MPCVKPTLTEQEIIKYQEKYMIHSGLEEVSVIYGLIGNLIRLKTLLLLWKHGTLCVSDLKDILDVPAGNLSQHLSKLKACRIVKSRKLSQSVFYSLTDHPFLSHLFKNIEYKE